MFPSCPPAVRRALAFVPLLALTLLSVALTGQAAAAPQTKYSLQVSTQSNRSGAVSLSGRSYVQPAKIHVFTTPTTGVSRVRFYLDNTSMSGTPRMIETGSPYDFAGTAADGTANPFDTATVSAGSHTITAAVEMTTGKTQVISASFSVTAPAGDTTKPSSPALSATPGTGQVALQWSAATDNVGVTRYEVWKDNTWVAGLSGSTLSHTVTNLTAGVSHTFRVVAYDAAGNYQNSNNVTSSATAASSPPPPPAPPPAPPPPPPPPPSETSPAPFPSKLKATGRRITDENGYVLPVLRGFNMHVGPGFTWDQTHFNTIAAAGGKVNRAVLHWDQFEQSQGVVNTTAIANLDLHIQRAQAAGIYTILELHLNVGRVPSWTSAVAGETEKYAAYGRTLTEYLGNRYGNPASPQYTKAVIGFGLNEPPIESNTIRNGNGSIPWLEDKQRQMISWFRAKAPSWIGFVAYGYASATPIYDDSWQNSSAADASPTAYDAVGGNVIIDVHDYVVGCTNTDPNCDGRQWNGMSWPTYQGGPQIGAGGSYTSSSTYRSQQAAFLKPYKTFSEQASIPLMLGEWGWTTGTGELAWVNDKKLAWANMGPVIEIQWNYDINASNTAWAARPGSVWRSSVASWLNLT